MQNIPYVSVIIPTRNEERNISRCVNSILNQDYPKDNLEILIIDGMSEDGTVQAIRNLIKKSILNVRILENSKRIVPCGLNIGIKDAKGEYIIRMDAHTEYASDYISKCINWLNKTGAENAGGPMRVIGNGYIGKAIELAHYSKFGLGGGRFHNEDWSGYVDTTYLGAWPKSIFDKIGLFDERLVRNQDIEFNARIRKNGGKVFLTPEIRSYYHCRSSLKGLCKQNFENGRWVVYTKAVAPYSLSWRHFVPLIFLLSLITSLFLIPYSLAAAWVFTGIAGIYIFTNLFFSVLLSIKNGIRYFFILPIVFITLHFSYGFGSIWGLITLLGWLGNADNKN